MAQISLDELYRGEGAGEKYGIAGEVVKDILQNGCPEEYDEETWREMLFVKHTLLAAEKMQKLGDTVIIERQTEKENEGAKNAPSE